MMRMVMRWYHVPVAFLFIFCEWFSAEFTQFIAATRTRSQVWLNDRLCHQTYTSTSHFVTTPIPTHHTLSQDLDQHITLCHQTYTSTSHSVTRPRPTHHTLSPHLHQHITLCHQTYTNTSHFVTRPRPTHHTLSPHLHQHITLCHKT